MKIFQTWPHQDLHWKLMPKQVMVTAGDPDSGIVKDLDKKKLLVLSVSTLLFLTGIHGPKPVGPGWYSNWARINFKNLAANLARNVEPIAMPETTEEYQKEFDLLIKQVQCKGMSFKIHF